MKGQRLRVAARWSLVCMILGVGAGPLSAQEEPRLSVSDHGVGTSVVERELQGRGESFNEGTQVWFLTRVVGGAAGDRVQHVWLREGKEMITVGLSIGGSHWRTYSHKTLHPGSVGQWAVEVRDPEGRVLARDEFTCLPGPAGSEPGRAGS